VAALSANIFVAADSNAAGIEYLKENAEKEGVIVLPSGLQYKVLTKGSGTDHPTADSSCSCHYHGTLIDGTVFDSSYDRGSPTSFAPNQVIKGWTEAMQMMVEGDVWELYIPSDLAYGDRGSPPKIQGGDTLVFKIEILKINGGKKPALKCAFETLKDCDEKETKWINKKMKALSGPELVTYAVKEEARLTGMKGKAMKPSLLQWVNRRLFILKQVTAKKEL